MLHRINYTKAWHTFNPNYHVKKGKHFLFYVSHNLHNFHRLFPSEWPTYWKRNFEKYASAYYTTPSPLPGSIRDLPKHCNNKQHTYKLRKYQSRNSLRLRNIEVQVLRSVSGLEVHNIFMSLFMFGAFFSSCFVFSPLFLGHPRFIFTAFAEEKY